MSITLSSYDIKHLVGELQFLVGGKIEKIFQQEKPLLDFLFSIHVPNLGRKYIFVNLPHALCLSSFKPSFPVMPPAFCSSLRRKILNAKITGIRQFEFQRIIIIDLVSKIGESTLVFELFSSGNILLLDQERTILATLHQKIWNEKRKILHGKTYEFPSQTFNLLTCSQQDFNSKLEESSKDSLVTFLAVECSLGGQYAEKIVEDLSLDKHTSPKEVDSKAVYKGLQSFLSQPTRPSRNEKKIYPIKFSNTTKINSFNEGIASVLLEHLEEKEHIQLNKDHKQSLNKFEKVIQNQTKQKDGLIRSAEENQKAGELLYNHYQRVQEILHFVQERRKEISYKELKEELKQFNEVVSFNEHTGEIKLELS